MLPISDTFLPKLDEKQTHYLKDICLKLLFCVLAIWGLQLSLPILPVIAPTTANNACIKQDLLIYLFISLYYFYYFSIKQVFLSPLLQQKGVVFQSSSGCSMLLPQRKVLVYKCRTPAAASGMQRFHLTMSPLPMIAPKVKLSQWDKKQSKEQFTLLTICSLPRGAVEGICALEGTRISPPPVFHAAEQGSKG